MSIRSPENCTRVKQRNVYFAQEALHQQQLQKLHKRVNGMSLTHDAVCRSINADRTLYAIKGMFFSSALVCSYVCGCIWVRWLTCYLFVCFLITFSYTERGPPCRICLRLVVSDLVNLPKMETRFCFFSVQVANMVGFYRIRDQKKNHFTCKHWHLPLLLTFCLCCSESQSVEEITESKKYHTSVLSINQIWRTLNFSMKLSSDRWFCRSMTEFLCALQFFNMIKNGCHLEIRLFNQDFHWTDAQFSQENLEFHY